MKENYVLDLHKYTIDIKVFFFFRKEALMKFNHVSNLDR